MILQELLTVPALASARTLAGKGGLTREVTSVNIMDAPDIVHFLKPGEMLLTTAYMLKDDPDALHSLMTNMNQMQCAGIAIKTKRFLQEVPLSALQLADQLHFPIIELSLDHTLGEVLNDCVSYLLEKKTDELKYSLESHQNFTNLILQGQGIPEIIRSLSHLLGSPALLLDPFMTPIAASAHFEAAPYRDTMDKIKQLLPLCAMNEQTWNMCLLQPEQLPCRQLIIHPIQTVQPQGYLIAFSDKDQDNVLPKLAIEQAVNIIRFELLKKQAVKERSRRYKSELLTDLVEGFFTSEQEILHRGRKYSLTEKSYPFCIVVKRDPDKRRNNSSSRKMTSGQADEQRVVEREWFYEVVKRGFSGITWPFAIFNKNDAIVFIVSLPKEDYGTPELPNGLKELLQQSVHRIFADSGLSVSIGVGNPVTKLLDCPLTFQEAMSALQDGYSSKRIQFVQFYAGKDTIDLFRFVPKEELEKFYRRTLAGLEELESKERQELLKTLHVYLNNHGQIADTAKQLFIHRNTVLYRLEKLKHLTGSDFDLPEDSLRYRIAFLMEPLIDT